MNAVERLWAALAAGDMVRAGEELHPNVVVEWPHSGQRLESREAFLAAHAAVPGARSVEQRRLVGHGHHVATETLISGDTGSWAIASFFDLHDGRISHAVEYWVQTR